MSQVLINVNVDGNEKSIPVEVLSSKKIKSLNVNFAESRVEVTYEGETNARENTGVPIRDVDREETDGSQEALTGVVSPVNEVAKLEGDVEEVDEPDAKVTVEMSGTGNEDDDKKAAHNADVDLDGDTSTTEGSDAGTKKRNSVA